ncbi:DUF4859 domain-containing protein [Roseimarinus sediminis]|uniref:DUF4859 domain-containing protein n=1 Tax=Roseimarinus sediminis TaxID=1610899 RepID=UPI003D22C8F3
MILVTISKQKVKQGMVSFSSIHRFMLLFFFLLTLTFLTACGDDVIDPPDPKPNPVDTTSTSEPDTIPEVIVLEASEVQDFNKFYKPAEHRNVDFLRGDSKWTFVRSRQSEHFVVFWEEGFGEDPNAATVPQALRVDIDDMLEKAELFYDLNVNELKFAEEGKSNLDLYKMQIYLFYTEEWMAYGSGYDDVIGALWVNPGTCKPVGSTIAHEIGHSFQYQVFCDLGEGAGFRYGFGGNGGNTYWEQCAQWQAYQSYPMQAFDSHHFTVYSENYFRHVCHEWHRYASYWMNYYWADKHGIDIIGKIWREAKEPEDPFEAYMRINNLSVEDFNAEMYDAATKLTTWDLDAIRDRGSNYIGKYAYKLYKTEDGSYQVAYSHCPGTTGYNVIPLNVPDAGTIVTTHFEALSPGSALAPDDPGKYTDDGSVGSTRQYNKSSMTRAGWRYGYVALLDNGQRVYGEMNRKTNNDVSFTIPDGCNRLWLVITGAPTSYKAHAWDELESNDDQWPYKVKFENTDLLGSISFDGSEEESDLTLSYDVSFPFSAETYPGAAVSIESDLDKLSKAFVLQPGEINSLMDSKIKFYAVESNGNLNETTTANGYGHWFDAAGNVINWGDNAMVYSEYDAANFTFAIGQYPGHCAPGDQFTIKQALVYEYESGKTVQATFVFNISIK